MNFLEKFNQTFREFMLDMIRCFPEDKDLKMYKMAINAAMLLDETLALTVFREDVVDKYKDKILARDASFFLENDYQSYREVYSEAAEIIEKMKRLWSSLGAEDQDVIWKYFIVLTKLTQAYDKAAATAAAATAAAKIRT